MQDEICKSIAENGGIDAVLRCIDDSGDQGNKIVARTSCSLLSKVYSYNHVLWSYCFQFIEAVVELFSAKSIVDSSLHFYLLHCQLVQHLLIDLLWSITEEILSKKN